tara:strand:+ start:5848 stop:6102 length:255 start_codon:yes stop_codon:yes gene_type:complete
MQHNIGGNEVMAVVKAEQKTKAEIEKEINEGIEKFLSNGGEIEYVKSNKSQAKRTRRTKNVETKKKETNIAKSLLDQIMNDESL